MGRILIAVLLGVAPAPAAALAAPPDPDGSYRGTHVGRGGHKKGQKISFRVSGNGRRITRVRTTATTLCVGPTLFDNRILVVPVRVSRIRVAGDGRFKSRLKPAKRTRLGVTGRRRGQRVKGRIEVTIANCSARDDFVARRVRRA